MARQGDTIFGPFLGKIGNLVGTTWRGIPVVRTAPKKSTKKPSSAQLLQRAKFSALMGFLHPIKPFLAAWFGKMEDSKSPFDLALSYHLKEAIILEGNSLQLLYPKVCISKGHLRGVEQALTNVLPGNILRIAWKDNSCQSFASADDMLTIVIYVPSVASFYFFEHIALRKDTIITLNLPIEAIGVETHGWATFVNITGREAATSCYFVVSTE